MWGAQLCSLALWRAHNLKIIPEGAHNLMVISERAHILMIISEGAHNLTITHNLIMITDGELTTSTSVDRQHLALFVFVSR